MDAQILKLLLAGVSLMLVACGNKPEAAARPVATAQPAASAPTGIVATRAMPELAVKHNCVHCHEIDRKRVGPAWTDVARRYKGESEYTYSGDKYPLSEGLRIKISKGGSGAWGQMPMPANDPGGTRQDDIKELVRFILTLE